MADPKSRDETALFALKVWQYRQGEVVSLMIHLGDRLGLYRAMAGAGPLRVEDLAQATGLHPRWVREWLLGQAAAGLVSYDGATFELTPPGVAVLADEEHSLLFAAGAFGLPAQADLIDSIEEGFRTGIGFDYDRQGAAGAHQVERMLGPWARLALVPMILPALDGVVAKLEAGARVADVGCGSGVALGVMAQAFPASEFSGFDPSVIAADRARERMAQLGVDNVAVHAERAEDMAQWAPFDFVIAFDCIHDMTRPAEALVAIRQALSPDATLLIKDIRSTGDFETNARNPVLAMLYGSSVSSCMASGMSEEGGAGLGTLGFDPVRAEAMCRQAGFGRFRMHDFEDPANLYYEVRP